MKISKNDLLPGEKLFAVGHPGGIRGEKIIDSDILYFSVGSLKTGLGQDGDYLRLGFSPSKIALLEAAYNLKNSFVTDIDISEGSSGGPVLNVGGEVKGMSTNAAVVSDIRDRYVTSSSIALRITTIVNEVQREIGADAYERTVSCK